MRAIKKGKYGTVQYVSENYVVRNKDLISKHVFAGNTRLVSKTVMQEEKSGEMVATEQGSYYYHPDHLGSSSAVTDKNGKFYEQLEYFPYGEIWVHNKATSEQESTPYKFTGKEIDQETGLYYFGYRYYDAKLSKWISADPAFEKFLPTGNKEKDKKLPAGGVFKSSNLGMYIYSSNNPVVFIDPDGNWDYPIHYGSSEWGGTLKWAQDKGISSGDAQKIATANNNMDTGRTDPRYGIQDHHFNTNNDPDTFPNNSSSGTSGDSRIILSEKHLEKAIGLWKLADQFESGGENSGDVQGLRDAALEHLGMGMHALQDVFAHSDEFVGREVGKWSHARVIGSFGSVPEKGPFADNPNIKGSDGSNRFNETKKASDNYLDRFIKGAGYKGDKK